MGDNIELVEGARDGMRRVSTGTVALSLGLLGVGTSFAGTICDSISTALHSTAHTCTHCSSVPLANGVSTGTQTRMGK